MPKRKERPSREELERMYNREKLSAPQIAKNYKVSHKTIYRWMDEFGIKIRDNSESKLPLNFKKPSKEELKRKYHEEGLSARQIAKHYKVSDSIIRKWMDESGLARKTHIEKGLWKNLEFSLQKAKSFLDEHPEYQELPNVNVILQFKGYSGLTNAISKYYGGMPIFRAKLNEHLGRQPEDESRSLLEVYVGGNGNG